MFSCLSAHLVGRCALCSLLVSFSRPSDLMHCNGKRIKLEAIRLTDARWCEIVAKLGKPNTRRVLDDANNEYYWTKWSYGTNEVRIENNHLSMTKSSLSRNICWVWKCYQLHMLWSCTHHRPPCWRLIALLRRSIGSWTDVWWTTTIVWDVSGKRLQTDIKCEA